MNRWRATYRASLVYAAAAMLALVIGLAAYVLVQSAQPAYALEQTGQALKPVRFIHIWMHSEKDKIHDERWIEITPEGRQGRYWQKSRGMGMDITVADNGKVCRFYRADKNTLVLYKSVPGGRFQWIGDLGGFLRDLAGKGKPGTVTVRRNVGYKGRPAHHVRLVRMNLDCYVDPKTKLPIAIGRHQIDYGDPPEGIFELATPKGVEVVDMTSGTKPKKLPDWLTGRKGAVGAFAQARRRLVAAENTYRAARALFRKVVKAQPGRNWAIFWLGRAEHKLGNYDAAIEAYTRVVKMFTKLGLQAEYCHLARGLAYADNGNEAAARKDFAKVLPRMIEALRNPEAAIMFEYADDPLLRDQGKDAIVKRARERGVPNMIRRLRKVTRRSFGYDMAKSPQDNEKAIAAWEAWWRDHAADYGVNGK